MPRALLPLLLLVAACRSAAPRPEAGPAAPPPSAPQQQPTAEQACALTACRPPRTVTLVLDEEREMRQELPPFPYVYRDVVYVVPGDDFLLTGEVRGDRLVNLRALAPGERAPAHTLRIRFSQELESRSVQRMVLALDSTLPRALTFSASMLQAQVDGFQRTPTCPVPAGKSSYESWPQALRTLVLEDLRLVDLPAGAAAPCE